MYNGILNVYKERGYTSFDVVARLRGICGQKKIGHTGTLDPDAEGVLPVCLGRATKVCDILTDRDKEYRAVMLLGVETDTQDMTGEIVDERPADGLTEREVRDAIAGFSGEISQIPPMYSALKVNGQKLCDLARAGKTVERQPRQVTIHKISVDKIDMPRVTMTVKCSKGTYIRTLCHDIGEKLGCHAALEHLVRTVSGGYTIENAHRLDEIEQLQKDGTLQELIRPIADVFRNYPPLKTMMREDKLLYNGSALSPRQLVWFQDEDADQADYTTAPKDMYRIMDSEGTFCAIYRFYKEENCFSPVKMFLPDDDEDEIHKGQS